MLALLALITALPLKLRALELGELMPRLQAARLRVAVPESVTSVTLPLSRAMMQSEGPPLLPLFGAATARAEMVGFELMRSAANSSCCGCWTMTSTALALPV